MADQDGSNNAQGISGAAPRITVKSDFRLDRFGPRSPLALPRESLAGAAGPAGHREGAGSGPVAATKVVGWCSYGGCSEGFASWEDHVEHFKKCHLVQGPDSRAVCSECLVQVINYEGHMLSHRKSRNNCSQCSASFVNQDALMKHKALFHRRSPPQPSWPRQAGAASSDVVMATAAGTRLATTTIAASGPRSATTTAASGPRSASSTAASGSGSATTTAASGPRSATTTAASGPRSATTTAASGPRSATTTAASGPRSAASTASCAGDAGAASTPLGWCTFEGCPRTFLSWERFVEHWKAQHCPLRDDPSLCAHCLQTHREPHGDGDRKCSWCSARFVGSFSLTLHRNLFHRVGDFPMLSAQQPSRGGSLPKAKAPVIGWCTFPLCDQPFRSWEDHVKHHANCHLRRQMTPSGISSAICHMCSEWNPAGGLQSHHQQHRQGDVPCGLCAARFIGDVTSHQRDFHHVTPDGSVPPVLGHCVRKNCVASFTTWEDQVHHFIERHWKKNRKDPARVCRLCLSCLPNVAEAKKHAEQHAVVKVTHRCRKCPALFVKAKALGEHMQQFHRCGS